MTTPNDINNLDSEDIGLKQIFGDRFHDETVESSVAARKIQESSNISREVKAAEKPAQKPRKAYEDAKWEPAKPEANWMDKLKGCVAWSGSFAALSLLVFYWEQAGLMAESIAVPCIAICTALAGWGVGKTTVGGKH